MTDTMNTNGMAIAHEKLENLKSYLKGLGSVAIAFSSGVDSTFLLAVAHEVLGDKAVAVTAASESFPQREAREAEEFCKAKGIRQIQFDSDEINIPGYRKNPTNRCYLCKKGLFEGMKELTDKEGIAYIAEGSNMDDNGDYRPGLQAIKELEILSPLRHVELYKSEIRALSKEMGLPTWRKQSYACLASRFVYGEEITEEKLRMVDLAEEFLLDKDFYQLRVRIHGTMARIEVLPDEFDKILAEKDEIVAKLKEFGFSYVTLDLQGYRTGSMNETLDAKTVAANTANAQ